MCENKTMEIDRIFTVMLNLFQMLEAGTDTSTFALLQGKNLQ